MSDGAQQIVAERGRQIASEDYSLEYDLTAGGAEPLIAAARAYVLTAGGSEGAPRDLGWPWPRQAFKPTTTKRDLVKAGALIAAAIDQIDLAEQSARPLDERGFDFRGVQTDQEDTEA